MKINKFPDNLKMIRKQSQLSQEELGKKINVSKQTVSKYEKGIVEPNFHTLVEISKVFNCSLDSLVFGNIKLKSKNPALLNLEIEKKMNLFTKEISDTINNYFEYDNNLDSTEEYSEELSQFDIVSSYYCKNKNVNSIDIEFYTNNNIIIFNAPKYKHLTNLSDNKFSNIQILADVSAGYPPIFPVMPPPSKRPKPLFDLRFPHARQQADENYPHVFALRPTAEYVI